jgi:hypothetical protein
MGRQTMLWIPPPSLSNLLFSKHPRTFQFLDLKNIYSIYLLSMFRWEEEEVGYSWFPIRAGAQEM